MTLLVTHIPLGHALHIEITAAACAMIPAGVSLAFLAQRDRLTVYHKIDKTSLVFFAGLFVLIGGLEKVHIFEMMAEALTGAASSSPRGLVVALQWGPGLMSGVVDNVPLALAMSYVLEDLALRSRRARAGA